MSSLTDTIVAPVTGNQPAAVGIVRVSGPQAWEIGSRLFEPWPNLPEDKKAIYGRICTGDDGLALPFVEGRGYTGEQTVEFHIHGSLASVNTLVEACLREGARMADPGEFTQRAFLNGKIDLTQAEAVKELIEARSEAQLRHAGLLRDRALHRAIENISEVLLSVLAAVEASVDFSEEVGPVDRAAAETKLTGARKEIENLLATAPFGRVLRQGVRIAIVGPPNAGKSSVLNALVGAERAIVTDIPGTTRDYVEEEVILGGLPCVLIDTAGLRETEETVEKIGVERSRTLADQADHVWYVFDSGVGLSEDDRQFLSSLRRPVVLIANKSDLGGPRSEGLAISAANRKGFDQLNEWASSLLHDAQNFSPIFVNTRHEGLLTQARDSIDTALSALYAQEIPDDLVAVGLQGALRALDEITGKAASIDMLDRIFRDFCIGK